MCGEYGEKNKRAHYHAILFGFDFPDKHHHHTQRGNKVYTSDLLDKTWGKGFADIGTVNYQSAAYTARYILKKQYGTQAEKFYGMSINLQTRKKEYRIHPEYTKCSLKPGIGKTFYEKYFSDLFPRDVIHMNGRTFPMPDYYRKLLAKDIPGMSDELKALRLEKAKGDPKSREQRHEKSKARMAVKEKCHQLKANRLLREI